MIQRRGALLARVAVSQAPEALSESGATKVPSRAERALRDIDPAAGVGLEIGALTTPLLTPALGPVEYADHLPTAELRGKYRDDPNVDIDAIVEVHHVIGDQPLPAVTGSERFHHVVASHVIEHAPDLIGFEGTRFGELEFFVSLRAPTRDDAADEAQWLQRVEASIPQLSAA